MTLLLGPAALASGEGAAAPEWKHVTLDPRPQRALLGCRSPTFVHEILVPCGQEWAIQKTKIVFAEDGKELVVRWASSRTKGGERLPIRTQASFLTIPTDAGDYGVGIRSPGSRGAVLVASTQGAPIQIGDATAWIVDSNLDAVIGNGGDGLVAPEVGTVAPWCGEVWHRSGALELRQAPDGSGWVARGIGMPYPQDPDHSEAFRMLNWRRQQTGMKPVAYDRSLEAGMSEHARYMALNGTDGHDEAEGRPGFTAEGARAGAESVLGFQRPSYVEGVRQMLMTLYHRDSILHGGLARTAMLLQDGYFLLRAQPSWEGDLPDAPVVFPPHGMSNVARRFCRQGEEPMPVETRTRGPNTLGCSIGIYHRSMTGYDGLTVQPQLKVSYADGDEIKGAFHYPGRPPRNPGHDPGNLGEVAITPDDILRPAARVLAAASIVLPGGRRIDYEWEFTTGKSEDF